MSGDNLKGAIPFLGTMTKESDKIAIEMIRSEAFTWLMVGANHPEAHLSALREAWDKWIDSGGLVWWKKEADQ